MHHQNLKELLTEQARLQAKKSQLTTSALKAIENELGLIDSDLKTVTGLISEIVADGADQQRAAQDKETGAVNFVRDGIKVTHTISKSVTWDQKELGAIAARIAGAGENPNDYMTSSYKVSERDFKNWSKAVQNVFNKARTVKPGKPKITFKEV